MPLRLILGAPGAGKARRALDEVRARAAGGERVYLCVPGAVERDRFLRELGATRGVPVFDVEVGSFEQLVLRLAGSPPVRRTTPSTERLVMRDALQQVPAFADARRWTGFVDTARTCVDRLRRAAVWGEDELSRVRADLPGADDAAWDNLRDQYEALLRARHLYDDAWFERRASEALRRGTAHLDAVVVHGFGDLPSTRVRLIDRTADLIDVTITLDWRPGSTVHERAAALRDHWRDRGAFLDDIVAPDSPDTTTSWLARELFEPHPQPPPPDHESGSSIAFVDCCGPLQEADEVVREVATLIASGCAPDDIAVASCAASYDAELLRAAFRRAGIPARFQIRRTALDTSSGRALHELLTGIIERDALRATAALRAPSFDIPRTVVDAIELTIRRERHERHVALPASLIDQRAPGLAAHGPDDPGALPLVMDLLSDLLPADLGELDLLRGIATHLDALASAAETPDAVTLRDVAQAIASFPLAVPDRTDLGAVVVTSLDDMRSLSFDAVVLRGMHLAAFRAQVEDERDAPAAMRDLLHVGVSRARRLLRVVRQVASASGGHLAPSPAWTELRRLCPSSPLRTRALSDVVVSPADVRLPCEAAPAVARAHAEGRTVDDVPAEVLSRVEAARTTVRSPRLAGDVARELAAMQHVAATSVELYDTCSAKWFIERCLRLRNPDDDRAFALDGTLAHALLQHVLPPARRNGWSADQVRADIDARLAAVLADVDPRGTIDAARAARVVHRVIDLIEAEADWQIPASIDTECGIGTGQPNSIGPGLNIDGVEVVGRIDRVDHYGSQLVLHDYKLGTRARQASKLIESHDLQLLIYWLALTQPGAPVDVIAAMYRSLGSAGAPSGVYAPQLRELGIISSRVRSGVLDDDQRDELLDDARDVVTRAVTGMREGHVAPLHDPAKCPSHCRWQTVCRVGERAFHPESGQL